MKEHLDYVKMMMSLLMAFDFELKPMKHSRLHGKHLRSSNWLCNVAGLGARLSLNFMWVQVSFLGPGRRSAATNVMFLSMVMKQHERWTQKCGKSLKTQLRVSTLSPLPPFHCPKEVTAKPNINRVQRYNLPTIGSTSKSHSQGQEWIIYYRMK